jgi:dienelactone hydrolase
VSPPSSSGACHRAHDEARCYYGRVKAALCVIIALSVATIRSGHTSTAAAAPMQTSCRAPFNVGFDVVRVANLNVAIWYPSPDREMPFEYATHVPGTVARDGALNRCSRFPLVVFSHGFGGCGIQSVFFTEELARQGYIVVAPDHHDALCSVTGTGTLRLVSSEESFLRPERWTDKTHVDRRDDLRDVINWSLKDRRFRDAIAPDRIAGVGHSVGGYVVLGMAGGWSSWRDDRLRAALLFSPFVAPFLVHKRIEAVDLPKMYQGAQGDWGITPSLRRRSGAYARSKSPKYYVELKRGNHFVWTNLQCWDLMPAECRRKTSEARLITEYGIAFLDRYLKGNAERLSLLKGEGAAASRQAP